MDSEKNTHMRELLEAGRPVTDEGPYYHHAWWEAYKGSVKGKLGGGLLGAGIGAITGLVAVGIAAIVAANLAVPVVIGSAAVGLTMAGFAAAGMLYGVHEFAEVGKVTGAVASAHKTSEKRMKAFEEGKFAEIKEEINELKALVKGEPVPAKKATSESAALKKTQEDYRTQHFQGSKVNGIEKIVFWKIALAGLVVGAIAGAILATGGAATHLLHGLGVAEATLGPVGEYVASMTAMGAIGASFGINRDIFRQIFDQTDMWFRGFISHSHSRKSLLDSPQPEQAQAVEATPAPKQTVFYDGHVVYPTSKSHHQDKYALEKQRLGEMDHTQMLRQ